MSPKIKKLASVISSVELDDVRLVEASVQTTIRSTKEAGDVDITFKPGAKVPAPPVDGVFYILATAELDITSRKTKASTVSIRATYELRYHLPEELPASATDLNQFAQTNGIFNAWPFFREFVQSSFERMHLPTLTLPVYRLGKYALKSSSESVSSHKRQARQTRE